MAEQFCADLRLVFPSLNVVTTSTNKLLELGYENAHKVFFPAAGGLVTARKVHPKHTCVLLISQSGQVSGV